MTAQAIIQAARLFEVPYLVHFTRVTNLPSILQHGIYPISRVHEIGTIPDVNDTLRLDGHTDATSLSIAFPNYRMFWRYRQDNPDVDWVVLAINPSVLWTKNCAFCRFNAADARISRQLINQLKTPASFIGMFEEIDGLPSRQEQRLNRYDPTDVQAEVLAFDIIEPELIIGASFNKATVMDSYRGILGSRQLILSGESQNYFASRSYVR
ncbi:DarT ssDNA thymidine ADP-ribosyltransferase family protein [Aeromonas enteropelogenes]|uniref:DarT ssDNA thymidine ADP-ribosyltransferase family protein n=1 Tax=Aeromonas enteropelogenes TaxID=29489 RepID=UPI003986DE52